ncbi:MAG: hypothetical protein K9J17_17095, partial [Flavobacteriales bacterium]|nr:hypothetical protein [Flavobacteriales bacterium]
LLLTPPDSLFPSLRGRMTKQSPSDIARILRGIASCLAMTDAYDGFSIRVIARKNDEAISF